CAGSTELRALPGGPTAGRRTAGRRTAGRRTARAGLVERERQLVIRAPDPDVAALRELAEQQLVGERTLDLVLDHPAQRARAVHRVVALARQVVARRLVERQLHLAVGELRAELGDELVDDLSHHALVQRREVDLGVEPVAELRRE